jgi:hypothetical protein
MIHCYAAASPLQQPDGSRLPQLRNASYATPLQVKKKNSTGIY